MKRKPTRPRPGAHPESRWILRWENEDGSEGLMCQIRQDRAMRGVVLLTRGTIVKTIRLTRIHERNRVKKWTMRDARKLRAYTRTVTAAKNEP
jgi:hypothetical protein